MWKVIIRRILLMIPQLFILSILIFFFAKLMPGDPFSGLIGPHTDPHEVEALRRAAGLYDPWWEQYLRWLGHAIHGNLGMSYNLHEPVTTVIGQRAVNTFWMSLLSVILTYLFAIPMSIVAARNEGKWQDQLWLTYNSITFGIPPYVFYLLIIFIFGTVGIFTYFRSGILDEQTQDYVRTARAKGVKEKVIFRRHILRNASLPIASNFGFVITGLLGGAIFAETIFGYPGLGQLFITSITGRDYSMITALILLNGFLGLLGALLSDIIMAMVDPRIRIQ